MTSQTPFVSVVIPTRNRPDLVRYAMQSLSLQTFGDFEVIVCDNHTGTPCRHVFDEIADERFSYRTPTTPLAMHDNWEWGCELATGEFVTVLIDKTVLRPSALQILHRGVETHPAELYSWWAENYRPDDEQRSYDDGWYGPLTMPTSPPSYFDATNELRRRYALDVRRGTEGIHYFWGKICFGAYHRDLIRRIKDRTGRLFYAINPDYTSMLAALAHTRRAVDLGEPLLLQFMTRVSNGARAAVHPEASLQFLTATDPSGQVIDSLPVRGLYSSQHNVVAHDYVLMKELIGEAFPDVRLDMINLLLRVREDLQGVTWPSDEERDRHHRIYRNFVDGLTPRDRVIFYRNYVVPRIRSTIKRALRVPFAVSPHAKDALKSVITRIPALQRAVEGMLDRKLDSAEGAPEVSFGTILEAAAAADRHYRGGRRH